MDSSTHPDSSSQTDAKRSARPVLAALRLLHRGYKVILSPLFGTACRFTPSCSDYALEAIEIHGILRGLFLAFKRVVRCHPYCCGGDDPVPRRS